jgi:serine/threonine-protein kinase HipA
LASLIIWMNGEKVGEWGTVRGGSTSFFRYESSWAESSNARALSLSIPITADREVRGPQVANYFDNLLPDNPAIRSRIRSRFGTASTEAFDLLTAIGRDCVGAVQILPPDEEPVGWNQIDVEEVDEEGVASILRSLTSPALLDAKEQDEFRISLAGAQEKTALVSMAGKWFRPRHATPTTHILKLPLGMIGGFKGDFSHSVENEWLCAKILSKLGFVVAVSNIARFGEQIALTVRRFDRRWIGVNDSPAVDDKAFTPKKGMWVARLPQEDFCQATGRASTAKYEAEGGPSIAEGLSLLANSEYSEGDRADFVLAQLAFWLLAAPDGHGKNFSLYHRAGGRYGMTPLYDVISAWPIIGKGKNQLSPERVKLAMAIHGKNAHYRIHEIAGRHWEGLAQSAAIPGLWPRMNELVEAARKAVTEVSGELPDGFPEQVYEHIRRGVLVHADRFNATRAPK